MADEEAERAAGLTGGRRRVAPLNEDAPEPLPRRAGGKPRAPPKVRQERLLRALQENKRLPQDDAREARRQAQACEVHNWLKKHSNKAVPRTELSKRQRELLRGCFQLLDGDGSGTVEPVELGLAMSNLGFSKQDVRLAFERCDRNRDGKLDFEDFVQLFTTAWAHREKRVAFADSFARDMSEVVAQACRPVVKPVPGEDPHGEERVTTSFPFALVVRLSPPRPPAARPACARARHRPAAAAAQRLSGRAPPPLARRPTRTA